MTGTELWIVRDWLIERARECAPADKDISESESHPLACVIIDMLNEAIKENLLTTGTYIGSEETIADCVRSNRKIPVIKTFRTIFGEGLKGSKDYVESQLDTWLEKVK
jgi:hypothetical protein